MCLNAIKWIPADTGHIPVMTTNSFQTPIYLSTTIEGDCLLMGVIAKVNIASYIQTFTSRAYVHLLTITQ